MNNLNVIPAAIFAFVTLGLNGCTGGGAQSSSSSLSDSSQPTNSLASSSSVSSLTSSSSVSSLASSSAISSEPNLTLPEPNFENARAVIDGFCTNCHFGLHENWGDWQTEEAWLAAETRGGDSYIDELDPDNSLLLRRMVHYAGPDSDMPRFNANQDQAFSIEHYNTVLAWVKSLGENTETISDGTVTIEKNTLDENGLTLNLRCTDLNDSLQLTLLNPEQSNHQTNLNDFTAITARPSGLSSVNLASIASSQNNIITLIGEGEDIWDQNIFFNALSTPIIDGKLNLTLDILSAEGVNHDFAKVGIMLTDKPDLTGQMVFVHWSSRKGLAEDSGNGVLNEYRQIAKNPDEAQLTPMPSRLQAVFDNESLKVGACYNCDKPALGLAKSLNFEPSHAFIVASSHNSNPITTQLRITNAYAEAGQLNTIAQQPVQCVNGTASVFITHNTHPQLAGLERIRVEISRANQMIASGAAIKTFSNSASCNIRDSLLPPQLRRLSQSQLRNSVIDVFGDLFDNNIWPNMEDGAKLIGMNTTADKLNINNLNFERWLQTTLDVVDTLILSHNDISACATSQSDCIDALVSDIGLKLWRRPLTTAEQTAFNVAAAEFANNENRLRFVLQSLLLSEQFLFRREMGAINNSLINNSLINNSLINNNARMLNNYEQVAILSYALWDTTPDQILLELAAQSAPLSQAQLTQQIERLFNSPRAQKALMGVYKDYLKLDLVLTRPKADELAFTDAVRQDVLTSAEQQLENNIMSNPHFMDVFDGSSFYMNNTIDYLFNTEVSNNNLTPVAVDDSQRQGLLNHPAFLAVHSTFAKSGIVKRGVFTLEQLLCQELPDPPGDVMPQPVPEGVDPATTSERDLLLITHSSQAGCNSCHKVIDPAGFGFENFDAIGRYRTTEKGSVTIDASGTMDDIGEHILTYRNSAEFSQALIESPQMYQCVSHRFLESFLGQPLEHNACELEKYQNLLSETDGSVKDLLVSLIQLESFNQRLQQ